MLDFLFLQGGARYEAFVLLVRGLVLESWVGVCILSASAWTSTTTRAVWQLTLEVGRLHLCLRPLDTKNQNGLSKIDI